MKNVVIMIMLISSAFSCKEQEMAAPINETQYTLEQLENDPNWVEITDFEMLEIPCLNSYELEEKYYFKTNDEYQILKNHFYDNSSCTFNALPEVNFDKEEVIGVSFNKLKIAEEDSLITKIFINNFLKEIFIHNKILYKNLARELLISKQYFWIKLNKEQDSMKLFFEIKDSTMGDL